MHFSVGKISNILASPIPLHEIEFPYSLSLVGSKFDEPVLRFILLHLIEVFPITEYKIKASVLKFRTTPLSLSDHRSIKNLLDSLRLLILTKNDELDLLSELQTIFIGGNFGYSYC